MVLRSYEAQPHPQKNHYYPRFGEDLCNSLAVKSWTFIGHRYCYVCLFNIVYVFII